jgi:hypothetical protein
MRIGLGPQLKNGIYFNYRCKNELYLFLDRNVGIEDLFGIGRIGAVEDLDRATDDTAGRPENFDSDYPSLS